MKPTPGSQLALFATYSYHAFITDRDGETLELEADHRRHAEVENAIRDLKYGVGLNHLPSGRFAANGAWPAGPRASAWESGWWPPRPSGAASSPSPNGSPVRHAASPCISPNAGPGKPSSVAPWPGCKPFRTRLDYAVDNRTARRTTEGPRRVAPAQPAIVSSCMLTRQSRPATPPWAAIGALHSNCRPPPPHLLESSPDRRVPMSLTPCSNAMAASHRWIRVKPPWNTQGAF